MKPKKIYVLGHSRAGSTYLAEKLSKETKIKHYDLDDIRFIKKFTKSRTPAQRKKLVDNLLKKKEWILDGRGTDWDRHAMLKADKIMHHQKCNPKLTKPIKKQ